MSITVTAVDSETGERAEYTIEPGMYAVITADPCYLAGEVNHANGTHVLTLMGCRRMAATRRVETTRGNEGATTT